MIIVFIINNLFFILLILKILYRGYLLFGGEYQIYFIECVENIRIFMSAQHVLQMKYIWYLLKKSKFSFYFILFRRFTVNQFVNHALSRITIM